MIIHLELKGVHIEWKQYKVLEKKTIEGIKLIMGNVCAGIDVSEHNGSINWQEVKNITDFAVIRCGYGQNSTYQDDKYFENNIQSCIANNIPIEIYLYSYADNISKASSEADHVIRLCDKYKNKYKIWIANYPGNSQDVLESKYSLFKSIYEMWQFTSSGIINGIVSSVDLNIRF